MAPFNIHILDWHVMQFILIYIHIYTHIHTYTLFCFGQIEILTAPWIHLSFPVLCHSHSHLHLLRCNTVPEGLAHKVFFKIVFPQTKPSLQPSTNRSLGSIPVGLFITIFHLTILTPGEQILFFLSFLTQGLNSWPRPELRSIVGYSTN